MGTATDRDDPGLHSTCENGQQEKYLVLSAEERSRGFIRPVRRTYTHVGIRPKYPVRDMFPDEKERYADENYTKWEEYPKSEYPAIGRYWTDAELQSGCNSSTIMGQTIAETYARSPKFYGATFCMRCGKHLPVGEFVWEGTDERVGS